MRFFLFKLIFFVSISIQAQQVTCDDLQEFIEANAWEDSSLSSYILESSWLYKVTKYSYKYKNYIIAEIKIDEYSYRTRSYIFCNIPDNNWTGFKVGYYDDDESYGKRFHKYIMDYQCNCY